MGPTERTSPPLISIYNCLLQSIICHDKLPKNQPNPPVENFGELVFYLSGNLPTRRILCVLNFYSRTRVGTKNELSWNSVQSSNGVKYTTCFAIMINKWARVTNITTLVTTKIFVKTWNLEAMYICHAHQTNRANISRMQVEKIRQDVDHLFGQIPVKQKETRHVSI